MSRGSAVVVLVGVLALAASVWTVGSGLETPAETLSAVLVPALFVLAGLLGPLWQAASFTCRALTAIGSLHIAAVSLSAAAQVGAPNPLAWHLASQVLFVAGFGVFLPLASGYPAGPASRVAWLGCGAVCLLPLPAAFAAPSPPVLAGSHAEPLGPVAPLLPAWAAALPVLAFLMPVVAVGIAIARMLRGGRETRGRLALPLAALAAFALLLGGSAVLPTAWSGASTAVFLVSAPLVPAGLVAGSRALRQPFEAPIAVPAEAALQRLTPREREVLAAMAAGESNAAVARRLHISLSAVEKHTTAIFTKLDLGQDDRTHRRVAAVVAYLRSVAG